MDHRAPDPLRGAGLLLGLGLVAAAEQRHAFIRPNYDETCSLMAAHCEGRSLPAPYRQTQTYPSV